MKNDTLNRAISCLQKEGMGIESLLGGENHDRILSSPGIGRKAYKALCEEAERLYSVKIFTRTTTREVMVTDE